MEVCDERGLYYAHELFMGARRQKFFSLDVGRIKLFARLGPMDQSPSHCRQNRVQPAAGLSAPPHLPRRRVM